MYWWIKRKGGGWDLVGCLVGCRVGCRVGWRVGYNNNSRTKSYINKLKQIRKILARWKGVCENKQKTYLTWRLPCRLCWWATWRASRGLSWWSWCGVMWRTSGRSAKWLSSRLTGRSPRRGFGCWTEGGRSERRREWRFYRWWICWYSGGCFGGSFCGHEGGEIDRCSDRGHSGTPDGVGGREGGQEQTMGGVREKGVREKGEGGEGQEQTKGGC